MDRDQYWLIFSLPLTMRRAADSVLRLRLLRCGLPARGWTRDRSSSGSSARRRNGAPTRYWVTEAHPSSSKLTMTPPFHASTMSTTGTVASLGRTVVSWRLERVWRKGLCT